MDVTTLKIRGDDAIRLLNEHRSRYRSTGLYPFLIGDAEDLERVEQAVEFHEQDAAAILTASLEIEPAQWFTARQREAEKYEFSADETLGDWPAEALDKGSIMLHKMAERCEPNRPLGKKGEGRRPEMSGDSRHEPVRAANASPANLTVAVEQPSRSRIVCSRCRDLRFKLLHRTWEPISLQRFQDCGAVPRTIPSRTIRRPCSAL